MQIKSVPPSILVAATSMLQQYIPELSPKSLVAALKSYNSDSSQNPANTPEKPYTRQEVCNLLSISIPTLHRMIKAGAVRKIIVSKNLVRIDPASVRKLLNMEPAKEA